MINLFLVFIPDNALNKDTIERVLKSNLFGNNENLVYVFNNQGLEKEILMWVAIDISVAKVKGENKNAVLFNTPKELHDSAVAIGKKYKIDSFVINIQNLYLGYQ